MIMARSDKGLCSEVREDGTDSCSGQHARSVHRPKGTHTLTEWAYPLFLNIRTRYVDHNQEPSFRSLLKRRPMVSRIPPAANKNTQRWFDATAYSQPVSEVKLL